MLWKKLPVSKALHNSGSGLAPSYCGYQGATTVDEVKQDLKNRGEVVGQVQQWTVWAQDGVVSYNTTETVMLLAVLGCFNPLECVDFCGNCRATCLTLAAVCCANLKKIYQDLATRLVNQELLFPKTDKSALTLSVLTRGAPASSGSDDFSSYLKKIYQDLATRLVNQELLEPAT